jgi:hypothetical protein
LAALLAQVLRLLGRVPDFRVFQFAQNLGQALLFDFEVKDTP